MKKLLYGGSIVNVFTDEIYKANVLIEDGVIIGVGDYTPDEADLTVDVTGKIITPGFIDGHVHIESTMLTPASLAKISLPHGTTAVIADPHEIANVCGVRGIDYMIEASEGIPLNVFIAVPSCVPATEFDESGAVLKAADIKHFYDNPRVVGLAEMMNYPGVIYKDPDVLQKIADAKSAGKIVDGHAPMIGGAGLDQYISSGIMSDHECSSFEEARERVQKGQYVMIREGTAAKNLEDLLPLFDEPYSHRCMLVTDDRHPEDLMGEGHIDNIVRKAISLGKSPLAAIRMATIQPATYFGLSGLGAVAPGYFADLLVLDNLETVEICDVYAKGEQVVTQGKVSDIKEPKISESVREAVYNSFNLGELKPRDFYIENKGASCRVIEIIPGQLITNELITPVDGVDESRDILKLAVIERHNNTGHMGLGYIKGIGLKSGAIASSVSHDSHNIIVIGTNDEDMAFAANRIRACGGNVVVKDGVILSEMALPVAGLMSDKDAATVAEENRAVHEAVHTLGVNPGVAPFMNMAFLSLPVIPNLKMTTRGLFDVVNWKRVELYE